MSETTTTISVLVSTRNNALTLQRTLEVLVGLDTAGVDVQFVIIDNNSTDDTERVIGDFSRRLNLQHLSQPSPGKNAGLNHALASVDLGEIIVFTDDDVTPREDWLQQVVNISSRCEDYDVFGGMTYVIWPTDKVPAWAQSSSILTWGFSSQADIGDIEGPFPAKRYPLGTNYWIRRSALDSGVRFDEGIGPHPRGRSLGDETKFQMALEACGYKILYSHHAVVGHRVRPSMVTPSGIRSRAALIGRTGPNLKGPSRSELLSSNPMLWRALRTVSLMRYGAMFLLSWLTLDSNRRVERNVAAIRGFWCNLEMLRLAAAGHPLYQRAAVPIDQPLSSSAREEPARRVAR